MVALHLVWVDEGGLRKTAVRSWGLDPTEATCFAIGNWSMATEMEREEPEAGRMDSYWPLGAVVVTLKMRAVP